MSDLENLIRRIVDQMLSRQGRTRIGIVTSYDPNRYAAKVTLQPEGLESGWIPISTLSVGNGIGIAIGLSAGDQVEIGYHENDPESPYIAGRIHSDQERPPVAQSGEVVLQTAAALIKIDAGSNITITASGKLAVSTQGDIDLTTPGNIALSSATLKHNGVNVGSTHVHSGVTPGSGESGVPQ